MDTPDNLDDFPKRFLQPMMARWLSPDPSGLAAVNPANPQSWNAYAYVGDNPMNATDPLGLGVCQGAPLPGEPIPDGPVQFNCPSQGFVGGYLMQTFTVSATPEAAPAPMWEMACGPACVSGALGGAAAALQAAVNGFVEEMSYHPNSPGAGGGGGAGGGAPGGGGQAASLGPITQSAQPNIFNCPGCAQIWQNTDGAINASWYGTLALASFGLGDLAEGAGAAGALLSNWRTGLVFTLMTSPALQEAVLGAQDFEAGWNGWPSAVNPNWINAAGAETHRIVQCPPWDALAGSCG